MLTKHTSFFYYLFIMLTLKYYIRKNLNKPFFILLFFFNFYCNATTLRQMNFDNTNDIHDRRMNNANTIQIISRANHIHNNYFPKTTPSLTPRSESTLMRARKTI